MSFILRPCLASILLLIGLNTQSLAAPKIVTSIKPLHGIVSAIMAGVGEPSLIVDGSASPHHFTLKPSQALELQEADVIFWIGPAMESFLKKPLSSISQKAKIVELDKVPNLKLIEASAHDHEHEGEKEEEHADEHEEGHEKHEEEHADEHKHEDEHEEGHEKHVEKHAEEHKDEQAGEHADEHNFNPHIWLGAENVIFMSEEIATVLAEADPKNADTYKNNVEKFTRQLRALLPEIQAKLTLLQGKNYLVMHDAYPYFTQPFGLKRLDVIQLNENVPSGLAHMSELQEMIKTQNVVCIFSEPQLSQKLPKTLASDIGVKLGTLDPLGSSIDGGADHYIQLLQSLTTEFVECLGE